MTLMLFVTLFVVTLTGLQGATYSIYVNQSFKFRQRHPKFPQNSVNVTDLGPGLGPRLESGAIPTTPLTGSIRRDITVESAP